MRLGGVPPTLR